MLLQIFKEWVGFKKQIRVIYFRRKYPSAKKLVGLHDIIIVDSRHVEAIVAKQAFHVLDGYSKLFIFKLKWAYIIAFVII